MNKLNSTLRWCKSGRMNLIRNVLLNHWITKKRYISSEVHHENICVLKSHLELRDSISLLGHHFSFLWLRDHCRCKNCYNQITNQRKLNILDISPDIQPEILFVSEELLHITWPDGHCSQYPLSWLKDNSYQSYCESQRSRWISWNKSNASRSGIAKVSLREFSETQSGLRKLVKSLVTFGVGFIENVPPNVEATEKAVQKIAHVQHTFFGDMWEFSDEMAHNDTAYTREAIGAHTDNTYFTEASGMQVFHCLQHNGKGGETLLVDGFNATNKLKKSHPDSYHRLSTVDIESEYIEPGKHYSSTGPILKLHPVTGQLQQIRFNLFDRAPLKTMQMSDTMQFYRDLRLLAEVIADTEGEWWFKLEPGSVVLINNWRVLHGRAAYTGHRRMAGCYIGHGDWCSKARVLGLL